MEKTQITLDNSGLDEEIKFVNVQIPIQTARFIRYIEQVVPWGEVTVIVKNGIPVRAKIVMKEVKF